MKTLEMIKIDKRSNNPISHQIFMSIFFLILNGQFTNYTEIPSTVSLAKHLNVEEKHVLEAYSTLTANHFISKNDHGYYVSYVEINSDLFAQNSSLSQSILNSGKTPSNKLLSAKLIKASDKLYVKSKFDKNERLFEMIRVFYANEIPIFIVTSYVSLNRLPKFNEYYNENTPLYKIYKNYYNLDYHDSNRNIKVVALSSKDATIFNEVPGTATFLTTYYFYDQHKRQIGYAEIITSSHFAFTINIDI